MHNLFEIAELLHPIIGCLNREDQIACTQVCQSWSEVALDVLWYKVESLARVANALAPVRLKSEGGERAYVFEFVPGTDTTEAWSRFQSKYCCRVRIFCHNDPTVDYFPILQTFGSMKFSSSPVFPLLHTIAWDGFREYGLHDVVMFLHEGIRKCMLWGRSNGFSDPGVELLLTALQHRTPSLVALEVNFPPRPTLLDPLINLIGSLKSLVHLKVPGFRDTSRILSSIQNPSALKNLEFMTGFIGLEASGVATINDVLVHYTGVGDAFSQLERLRADLRNYKAIYPFFQGQGNFQCLTTVFVYVYAIDEPKSISGLFQGIAQTCPRMTQLRVQYSPFHCGRVEPQEVNIEFEDWSSILACKEITVFRFHTPYPLDLADHDIADIGLAWPRLETFDLFLNSKYFRTGPPLKNSPSLLSVFYLTRLCPNLKVVRLNLDDYPLSKTPPFTTENLPVQFHSDDLRVAVLDSLHIGPGIINQGDELIWPRLLGQICPPHCELSRDLQRVLSAHSNPAEDQKWRTILKLFPQFSELYSDLRSKDERIGALEQEVLSLTALKSPTG